MKTYGVLTFVGLLLVVSTTYAVVLHHKASNNCTVQKVRYDACGETISYKACDWVGRGYFKISVDYTMVSRSAGSLTSSLFITHDDDTQKDSFKSELKNACEHTLCPVKAGKPATFTEIVHVPKWADKVMKKWSVKLVLQSPKVQGPKCSVAAHN